VGRVAERPLPADQLVEVVSGRRERAVGVIDLGDRAARQVDLEVAFAELDGGVAEPPDRAGQAAGDDEGHRGPDAQHRRGEGGDQARNPPRPLVRGTGRLLGPDGADDLLVHRDRDRDDPCALALAVADPVAQRGDRRSIGRARADPADPCPVRVVEREVGGSRAHQLDGIVRGAVVVGHAPGREDRLALETERGVLIDEPLGHEHQGQGEEGDRQRGDRQDRQEDPPAHQVSYR
jgi:hypothetical protein